MRHSSSLLFAAFSLGLITLGFFTGAAVVYYQLPPSRTITEAFEAAEAWHEVLMQNPKINVAPENTPGKPKIQWNKKTAYNGYTLLSYRYSTTAQLIDMEGRVVHEWHVPFDKAFPNPTHIHKQARAQIFIETAHVFPNGDLLLQYLGRGDTPYGYGIAKVDKDSNVLWTYDGNAHHDFYIEKETGNIYAIVQYFIRSPRKGLEKLSYPLMEDAIVKLSPEGKELERIPLIDAFVGTRFEPQLFIPRPKLLEKKWDLFHTNAIQKLEPELAKHFPMFKPGYLLISIRSMGMLAVLDPVSKKIVWMQNGPWRWQHAARMIENGNIMVLDNLGYRFKGNNYAQVLQIDPATGKITWQFAGNPDFPLQSMKMGRLQYLPNKNILANIAMSNRLVELTPDKQVAWHYHLPPSPNAPQAIATATRYNAQELPFLSAVVH